MKICLSAWSCHQLYNRGAWSNVDFIDFVGRDTKAQGVELLTKYLSSDTDLISIEEALSRNNLSVACIGASNNFVLPNEGERLEQVEEIAKAVHLAKHFGAAVVRVFAGDELEGISYEQGRQWIVEGLKSAAAMAETQGIKLCLENHGTFAGKASQVKEIITSVNSPALRSTFDTGNFLLVEENPSDAIDQLQKLADHVHFKDFVKVEEQQEGTVYCSLAGDYYIGKIAGEGSVDLLYILGRLKDAAYEGWLTVEYEGDDDEQTASIQSIANLNKILQTL
ncbi:sugar phosphate isomerase/epimerase family protein [Cohnella abietis]|uniref:Xylose isomerase-like TIM barrel domain-containing protein n=1 Tax=Cohnella abietis TaxID=2507935 RepID=A0A3T1D5P6_9BACL|nr:sugar phosphate isomerase/epimerase [Cohnella abietis]BBI33436.1 hypothetical protein KCTCHS21_28350 [Cohnella abietis]